jgi:precorrin-2 dehydrogenase/sirohydrochlorin ferrochelatase
MREMERLLPLHLKVEGKKAVVVGGGKVAERKVDLLLESKAEVLLISSQVTKRLRELSERGKIEWRRRKYQRGDLKGAFIGIFAASDSKAEENFIEEARERGILVNISTDYKKCDFIFPAVVRNEKILITISTLGTFPLLSAEIAREIQKMFDDSYSELIDFLFEARKEIKRRFPLEERKKVLKSVLEKKFFIAEALKKGRKPKLEEPI